MIAGIDEAGRGALAGPIVSALVILSPDIGKNQFVDSKSINESKRLNLYTLLRKSNSTIEFSIINNKVIDKLHVLQATMISMKNCISKIESKNIIPNEIIIDGNKKPNNSTNIVKTCVKGDSLIPEISAASIVAKVIRDKIMYKYAKILDKYNFDIHKGYGTKQHYDSIEKYGITKIHRKSFNLNRQLKLF